MASTSIEPQDTSDATTTPNTELTPLLRIPSSHPPRQEYPLLICAIFLLLLDFSGFLQSTPQLRILESIICRDYYRRQCSVGDQSLVCSLYSFGGRAGILGEVDFDERRCKIIPVQAELATLRGWSSVFDLLPGSLLAIPYGTMADRYGRKYVFGLSLVGIFLERIWIMIVCYYSETFPIRLVWTAPAFQLIGGGSGVCTNMLYAIVADMCSRDERSLVFFRITAMVLIADFVASPISAFLMIHNVWLPMFVGVAFQFFASLLVILIPETYRPVSSNASNSGSVPSSVNGVRQGHAHSWHNRWAKLSVQTNSFFDDWAFLKSPLVFVLSLTFLINKVAWSSLRYLLQYTSSQFDWTLAKAGLLYSLLSGVNLLALVLVLPVASYVLSEKLHFKSQTRDLYMERASLIFLSFGCVLIAIPSIVALFFGLVIFSLGSGASPIIRSVLTSAVTRDKIGRMYAITSVMETLGGIFGGPVMAASFRLGLALRGPYSGLPFLLAACLFILMAMIVWFVSTDNTEGITDSEDSEE